MAEPTALSLRFARNCLDAEEITPTKCPCCNDIKLLLLDTQERIRAVGTLSLDDLRKIVAVAEAGELPPFNMQPRGGMH